MNEYPLNSVIDKAINNSLELNLTVKHGFGELIPSTRFQAYILGNDTYQYAFTWGYLPDIGLFYKFMLSSIVDAKVTGKSFTSRNDACYQHAIEEEHFAVLDGFNNIYVQSARCADQ